MRSMSHDATDASAERRRELDARRMRQRTLEPSAPARATPYTPKTPTAPADFERLRLAEAKRERKAARSRDQVHQQKEG